MFQRNCKLIVVASLALAMSGCFHNKKVVNPIANVNSKQPDKVLFDRAMDSMKRNKFDEARMDLETLINTYPDSEFIARAKLAVGDSWYAQGGTSAWQQAEAEYQDFQTFFPNMPEAAEAQLKIATMHFKNMEKPDRDFSEAKRAEDAYRTMIQQYPDSKLVPEAKQRLREVQEVLAEREYLIGRFYYMKEAWAPTIARLKTVVDSYPLYSNADEAMFLLAKTYENARHSVDKMSKAPADKKERLEGDFDKNAVEYYTRLINRYPLSDYADDARKRLTAMHQPVPTPSQQAIAQNKAEIDSREELSRISVLKDMFRKSPDVTEAAKIGEPTLADPNPASAIDVNQHTFAVMNGTSQATVERVTDTNPNIPQTPTNTPAPTATPVVSGTPAPLQLEDVPEANGATTSSTSSSTTTPNSTATTTTTTDQSKVTGTTGATGTATTPNSANGQSQTDTPQPPPAQVNQVGDTSTLSPEDNPNAKQDSDSKDSSSKKKKRKFGIF